MKKKVLGIVLIIFCLMGLLVFSFLYFNLWQNAVYDLQSDCLNNRASPNFCKSFDLSRELRNQNIKLTLIACIPITLMIKGIVLIEEHHKEKIT